MKDCEYQSGSPNRRGSDAILLRSSRLKLAVGVPVPGNGERRLSCELEHPDSVCEDPPVSPGNEATLIVLTRAICVCVSVFSKWITFRSTAGQLTTRSDIAFPARSKLDPKEAKLRVLADLGAEFVATLLRQVGRLLGELTLQFVKPQQVSETAQRVCRPLN